MVHATLRSLYFEHKTILMDKLTPTYPSPHPFRKITPNIVAKDTKSEECMYTEQNKIFWQIDLKDMSLVNGYDNILGLWTFTCVKYY